MVLGKPEWFLLDLDNLQIFFPNGTFSLPLSKDSTFEDRNALFADFSKQFN